MKIGIIGKGNVGTALGTAFAAKGHQIRYGHRDPRETVPDAAKWGEVVILAVPFSAVRDSVQSIGSAADGKILIDVTNAIGENGGLAIGHTTSAAEELQKQLPKARVVKAFNTVFAKNQRTGNVRGVQLTAFIAGDDTAAKQAVANLAKDIGFDPVDVGKLSGARYLEPMAMMLINLGYGLGMGTDIGYRLVRP
ncbi:MAG: NADPH-dependent F420 reductase [Methanomicrobiales archaeon]|nr:NADPH-dependent F420 reductase [Methanomicrobiales archaeon]